MLPILIPKIEARSTRGLAAFDFLLSIVPRLELPKIQISLAGCFEKSKDRGGHGPLNLGMMDHVVASTDLAGSL